MSSKGSQTDIQEAEDDPSHNLTYTGKKRGRKPKQAGKILLK
jgi:hypothetical protein